MQIAMTNICFLQKKNIIDNTNNKVICVLDICDYKNIQIYKLLNFLNYTKIPVYKLYGNELIELSISSINTDIINYFEISLNLTI